MTIPMHGNIVEELNEEVSRKIDITRDYDDAEILEIIEQCVLKKSREVYLSSQRKKEIVEMIFNSKRRLDVLQPLLEDSSVSEIMVNGTEGIFVERKGRIVREKVSFKDQEKLYNIINSIVAKVNRTVNESSPIVDARLSDGSRVSVVLPPVALNGPVITIRKFPEKPFTMQELVKLNSLSEEAARFLEVLVKA